MIKDAGRMLLDGFRKLCPDLTSFLPPPVTDM